MANSFPLLSHDARHAERAPSPVSAMSDDDRREPMAATPMLADHLGCPERKAMFDPLDVAAVALSLACLIVSVCVIHPSLGLAWKLGFESQIIIIGFLLSIQSLCMRRILPMLFMIIEARWGSSHIQDYEAILRQSVTLDHTHILWRILLFVMIALPLALSVAYKRFLGGTSSAAVTPQYPAFYGAAPLTTGNATTEHNPLAYALNATAPFSVAATNERDPPPSNQLPAAYGFNTLLLQNSADAVSAAVLDSPMPDYIRSIQQNLTMNEVWHLSATVNGTVTRMDYSIDQKRNDDGFWNYTFATAWDIGLSSWDTYDSFHLGMIAGLSRADPPLPWAVVGAYHSPQPGIDTSNYVVNSEDAQSFRTYAMLFQTERQKCHGEWDISKTAVRLTNGSCSGIDLHHVLFKDSGLFWLDVMPVMVHAVSDYNPTGSKNGSTWKLPAYTMSVAAVQWSRMLWINGSFDPKLAEAYYPAHDELVHSTVATLDTGALLYVVLAIQPLVTLFGFVACCVLYKVPISKGFGLVSLLAGMDRHSPALLQGAAFSGKLTKPVRLNIDVAHDMDHKMHADTNTGAVRYSLSAHGGHHPGMVERRKVYR